MKKTISIVLSAALALSLLSGCGGETPAGAANGSRPTGEDSPQGEDQSTVQGTAAELGSLASFSAGTLDGGTFTQDDVAAKDITVVNFWALSCGPCIAELPDLAELAQNFSHVRLRGLMAIPPISTVSGSNRKYFSEMRQFLVDIIGKMSDNYSVVDCLSMGMSGDYEDAITEGATLVRVGTALFGPRPPMTGSAH